MAENHTMLDVWLHRYFVLVAGLSLVGGSVLIFVPALARYILAVPPAAADPLLRVLLGVIGFFIALLGAAFLHALLARPAPPLLIFYIIWEKFGAALALVLGIAAGVFASWLWCLVVYDVASGLLIAWYWQHLRRFTGQAATT